MGLGISQRSRCALPRAERRGAPPCNAPQGTNGLLGPRARCWHTVNQCQLNHRPPGPAGPSSSSAPYPHRCTQLFLPDRRTLPLSSHNPTALLPAQPHLPSPWPLSDAAPKAPHPNPLFPSTASPTSAFLLVFPSPTTDTERTTCLAGEALPGRRVTGTGIPVRLSSTAPPGHEQLLRALLILRRGEERPHAEAPTARPRSPPDPRPECSRPAGPRPRPAPHLPAPSARPHWSARRARGPRHWMRRLSVRGRMGGATRAEQRAGLAEAKKGAGRGNDGGGAGRAAGSGGAGCAWDGAVAPKGIWDGDCEGRGPSKHSEAAAGPIRAQVYWCFPAAAPPASPQRDPYSSDPASNSGLPRP